MSPEVNLDPESIEAVAQRVAELLQDGGLIDAAEVARRFGVTRDYVYAHAGRLGAIPLSSRPKARLRFDPKRVADAMGAREAASGDEAEEARPRQRRRRPRGRKQVGSILPVHGKQP